MPYLGVVRGKRRNAAGGPKGEEPRGLSAPVYASTTPAAPWVLIGAAHVVNLAAPLRAVLAARPLDGVALELDPERAAALLAPPGVSRRGSGIPLFARLWGVLQRRLGASLGGGLPGAEMRTAWAVARERNLPVFLIDDPIRQTILNLVRSMPFKERVTLLVGSVAGLFVPARVVSGEMERYVDAPDAYVEELRRVSPTLARVLLDDRNEHMADRLTALRAHGAARLAVVVGDAHVPGLTAALARRGIDVDVVPFRVLRAITVPSSRSS
jgi:pheromone shutdown protein TraB